MIDKGILYRQNFGGGADMGGVKGDTRAANTGLSGGYQGGEKGGYGRRDSVQDRDRDVGVTTSAVGTLSDPTEKQDYFGSTVFGPSRKYTGSFLDNILSGGYRAVQPYAPDQFQSRFQQMGGGKGILSSLLGLVNPSLGIMSRVINAAPGEFKRFQSSPTLADYFGGFNFGAKNISDVYADQGRGSELEQYNLDTMQNTGIMNTGVNLNDYEGYRPRQYIEQAPIQNQNQDFDINYDDAYQNATYAGGSMGSGNYSQNQVAKDLYGKSYKDLSTFDQQQVDKAIKTYGTTSLGALKGIGV
jgi:hypothetical protein